MPQDQSRSKTHVSSFYCEELLAPLPTPKLEDHPLSAVCDCLFNIFTATIHIGGHSSVGNQRMCYVVVTGTHLSWSSDILRVFTT